MTRSLIWGSSINSTWKKLLVGLAFVYIKRYFCYFSNRFLFHSMLIYIYRNVCNIHIKPQCYIYADARNFFFIVYNKIFSNLF